MILVLGADGQVGYRLLQQLGSRAVGFTRAQCDIGRVTETEVTALIEKHQARWIINAAAFTAVDAAEEQRDHAMLVNADAPGLLARAAAATGARLLHLSTDYVFDGAKGAPYGEDALCSPVNHYGYSKWQGEKQVAEAGGAPIVLRLQWVYDLRGHNFYLTMKKLLAERDHLRVVADQLGAPGAAPDIAAAIVSIIEKDIPAGTYHLAAPGYTSWHGFACAIAQGLQRTPVIEALLSTEYAIAAPRPRDTRLDCGKLAAHGIAMPHWRDSLARLMEGACM